MASPAKHVGFSGHYIGHVEDKSSEKTATPTDVDMSEAPINRKAEKRLVRKQDLLILPLLALSIMFGYLDRGNIGNARLLGMQKDLGLTSQQYLNCVMMFFLGYMLVELPAGVLLRYCHPRYVFSIVLIAFGLFSTLFTVSGYAGIMVLRVLTGLGEAFVNNAYIYISLWYMPNELSLRTAAVYSMTPIAGATSGLLAYGVGTGLEDADGIASWQWLFLIEGVATISFGFVVLLLLPGLPEKVASEGTFLFRHESERSLIMHRLRASQNTSHVGFQVHQVWMAFKDPKFYLSSALIGPVGIGIGAFNVFLPTFINEFGYSPLHSQLLTIIPYGFALISLIFFAWLADRLDRKAVISFVCIGISCIGFIILLTTTNKVALIAGACFVASGAYPALVVSIAWSLTFHGGYTKKATAIWGFQTFVQCYSIIATQVYRTPPRFFLGHGIALGLYAIGGVSAVVLLVMLKKANAARQTRKMEFESRGEVDPDMEKSFEELGDLHPGWRYVL